MISLEKEVKKCYESAPFPDSLRKSKDFEKELEYITHWIKLNLEFLADALIRFNPKTVLCAGCGTGEEALALAKIYPTSLIYAIDLSQQSLGIAKQNIKKAKVKNIRLHELSILEGLPKLKQEFDFIYCAGVIHHLSNPELGFEILNSKLKPSGKMVIMLYNSYGLFLYKCQLLVLKILAGEDFKKRLSAVKKLGFGKGKDKVFIYDTYVNPQVKTFSIGKINSWAKANNLKLTGVVPPLHLSGLINFALSAQNYVFRRKKLLSIILKFSGLLYGAKSSKKGNKIGLGIWRLFLFQMIFLLLGKGECQYLLEKPKSPKS